MRVALFEFDGVRSWGFVRDGAACAVQPGTSIEPALDDDADLVVLAARAESIASLNQVRLLAPIPSPAQFIGIGLNYRQHAMEGGNKIPAAPVSFPFYSSAVAHPDQPIELPAFSREVDWEVELGIVIGTPGRDIALQDALRHVAGYTIVNDVSARDVQRAEGQWSRAKSFDTFKPMGPWMTTVDELGPADSLAVRLWVNGELKQSSSTADLIFDVPTLVSDLSRSLTLQRGTVISTGTPSGVGFARQPPEFLQPGDTVTLEIEGIGTLSNPVIAARAASEESSDGPR